MRGCQYQKSKTIFGTVTVTQRVSLMRGCRSLENGQDLRQVLDHKEDILWLSAYASSNLVPRIYDLYFMRWLKYMR